MFAWIEAQGLLEMTGTTVALRVGLSMLFSGVLGFERTRKRRAAGLRTYMLVCLGSCVVVMTSLYMLSYTQTDPARLGAQVINGIGFLGAGTIMVTGYHKIKGLTTAAGLWSAACMGIAIGAGFYFGALVMCVAEVFIMTTFDQMQSHYTALSRRLRLYIVFDTLYNLGEFLEYAREQGVKITDFETGHPETGAGVAGFFMVEFKERKTHAEIIEMFRHCNGLTFIKEL